MAEDEAVSKPVQTFGAKHPLMAYSRHGRTLARSSHSLFEHLARVDSLNESDSKGAKQCMVEFDLCRRKRTRNIAPLTKTPTDVFWEHLSSSAAVLTHPQETGPSGPSFPIEAAQDAYGPPNDKEPYSVTASAVFIAKHGQRTPKISLGQRARNISSEVIAVKDAERDKQCSEEPQNDVSDLGFVDRIAFTSSLKLRTKRRTLPCFSSPTGPKTKKAHHFPDVDESLSVVEAGSASTRPVSMTPAARHKDTNPQEFKELKLSKERGVKYSSDGFECDEARTGFFGKRRWIGSSQLNIGPLELTQKGAAKQKTAGPVWMRGQKKPRVATTTSPWSRRQYFGAPRFQLDLDEVIEASEVEQSKSTDQATRNRSKSSLSDIVSDDAEELVVLRVPSTLTDEYDTYSHVDFEINGSSRVKHDKYFSYNSDADESLNLLVFPVEDEDEAALAITPRTNTPEHGADLDKEADGQLPPKQWMLNVKNHDENMLALRPDSREWTRDITLPDISPRD